MLADIALKLVPVIVTVVPIGPEAGEKEVIVGGGDINVKPVKETVPAAVVTLTLPDAPEPTTAVIAVVPSWLLKDAAGTPPKLTPVTPVKFDPAIITVVPAVADVGLKAEITGVWAKIKLVTDNNRLSTMSIVFFILSTV